MLLGIFITKGFNPCSIGNCSGSTSFLAHFASLCDGFNPCSIGNCSGRYQTTQFERKSLLFQSLFYWKLLWKCKKDLGVFQMVYVSILVLLEIALEVVLDTTKQTKIFCFNPCSIGNCSGRN